jgi:hypothetical protein
VLWELSFVVNDGKLTSAPAKVAITVTPGNDPPSLTDPGPQAVDEGEALVVPVVAVDPDGDQVTVALEAGPAGLTWLTAECAGRRRRTRVRAATR